MISKNLIPALERRYPLLSKLIETDNGLNLSVIEVCLDDEKVSDEDFVHSKLCDVKEELKCVDNQIRTRRINDEFERLTKSIAKKGFDGIPFVVHLLPLFYNSDPAILLIYTPSSLKEYEANPTEDPDPDFENILIGKISDQNYYLNRDRSLFENWGKGNDLIFEINFLMNDAFGFSDDISAHRIFSFLEKNPEIVKKMKYPGSTRFRIGEPLIFFADYDNSTIHTACEKLYNFLEEGDDIHINFYYDEEGREIFNRMKNLMRAFIEQKPVVLNTFELIDEDDGMPDISDVMIVRSDLSDEDLKKFFEAYFEIYDGANLNEIAYGRPKYDFVTFDSVDDFKNEAVKKTNP